MIRLRDVSSGERLALEPPAGGELTLLAPDSEAALADFRLDLTADVLARTLERLGLGVRRYSAPTAQPADLAVTRLGGEVEGRGTPPARLVLGVAGVLLDDRGPEPATSSPGPNLGPDATTARASLRYLGLTAHYGVRWNFSPTGLAAADCALNVLLTRARSLAEAGDPASPLPPEAFALQELFTAALADDLDTPGALALLWQALRAELPPPVRRCLLLDFDRVLGLGLSEVLTPPAEELPKGAQVLIRERAAARQARDWARSDALRDRLAAMDVETRDTPEGSVYRRRPPGSSGTR
jgi:hypothetical protein